MIKVKTLVQILRSLILFSIEQMVNDNFFLWSLDYHTEYLSIYVTHIKNSLMNFDRTIDIIYKNLKFMTTLIFGRFIKIQYSRFFIRL